MHDLKNFGKSLFLLFISILLGLFFAWLSILIFHAIVLIAATVFCFFTFFAFFGLSLANVAG